jgi:RimJ/RimL family protein N-acetyltransferase
MKQQNRMNKFPELWETERLMIRPPRAGDGAEVNAAIRETYVELHQWMEWADHLPEVAETEANRCRAHEQFLAGEDFSVQAYLKTTGELAVCAGFHAMDWKVPKFQIGYWCRARYVGQGYVGETVRALTQIGFEIMKVNRIEIRCDERNERSRRVAERAGYRLEGRFTNDMIAPDGELRHTLIFALTPDTFRQGAGGNFSAP